MTEETMGTITCDDKADETSEIHVDMVLDKVIWKNKYTLVITGTDLRDIGIIGSGFDTQGAEYTS
jgi:hypothetical protein